MANTILGKVSVTPRGEYQENTSYEYLDVVSYNGGSFVALRDMTGVTPVDGADWMQIASRGAAGSQGIQGPKGDTPVKGVDYFTEADKQDMVGQVQSAVSADYLPKNQGAGNVGKILVVGTDGNLTLADMPEGGASGDVTGVLDESNNILLSGSLADGTYSLKWLNEDGSYSDAGSLQVGVIERYKNLADAASADWKENSRLSISSGGVSTLEGHTITNYIPCGKGDIVRVKGLAISNSDTGAGGSTSPKIVTYDSGKTKVSGGYGTIASGSNQAYGAKVTVDGDVSTYTVLVLNDGVQHAAANVAYIRIDGLLISGYSSQDIIITVNEEITE